jgi:hypothetical protein
MLTVQADFLNAEHDQATFQIVKFHHLLPKIPCAGKRQRNNNNNNNNNKGKIKAHRIVRRPDSYIFQAVGS